MQPKANILKIGLVPYGVPPDNSLTIGGVAAGGRHVAFEGVPDGAGVEFRWSLGNLCVAGWEFANVNTCFELFQDGTVHLAGYTIDELRTIATQATP